MKSLTLAAAVVFVVASLAAPAPAAARPDGRVGVGFAGVLDEIEVAWAHSSRVRATDDHVARGGIAVVFAHIREGRVEVDGVVPSEWEGLPVKVIPLTPDDPMPDVEACLANLAALGPMEYEPGERESIAEALGAMNQLRRL